MVFTHDSPATYNGPIIQAWPPSLNRSVELYMKGKCLLLRPEQWVWITRGTFCNSPTLAGFKKYPSNKIYVTLSARTERKEEYLYG